MSSIDFTKMLEKRAEALGTEDGGKFDLTIGDKTFKVVAQELAGVEWRDRLSDLQQDARDNLITVADMRQLMCDLYLDDQSDEFIETVESYGGTDPLDILQEAVQTHADQAKRNPTRPSSRSTRKPAKRR